MKKVFLVMVVLAMLYLVSCSKQYSFDDLAEQQEFTKLEITNGATGELLEVGNVESISEIIEYFKANSYEKIGNEKSTGYGAALTFYKKDEDVLKILVLSGSEVIINDQAYKTEEQVDSGKILKLAE